MLKTERVEGQYSDLRLIARRIALNNKYKILVVEDEDNILNFVTALLEAADYKVVTATSCTTGQMMFSSYLPDLVILDLGLPDGDGMILLNAIRKASSVPVIVLSARTSEHDKVSALDMGANDYVTKPFGSAELVARVRSALRNSRRISDSGYQPDGKFELGELAVDYGARRVTLGGSEVKLTQTEFNIVALLSEHCGKVLTYSVMISKIWGYNDYGSIKKLQVNMANIRKKFGTSPGEKSYIINELGVGYRMSDS